ncbi:hypothetical protein [Steroidobacter sp.]|uniref:hypothetical protein n=1 Tax=Steroidobacter sp. TaxID=1978227 RepID=UPI001A3D0702|nr:hypothetical protein [Steroidobacter sp.]MBL8264816.1 hypothetical protein [Steroidobacter sp.]
MNTLNTRIAKSFAIALATLALAAPFATQAHNSDAAMDSCINAFVAASLPKEQPVTVRKEEAAASPISIHSRAYKIVVSAKGVESGKYLARGTCIVDRSGQVIALNGKPLAQKLASR